MGRALRIGQVAALIALRGVWLSTLVVLPLFGMWLASSLAAYGNATPWLALLIGLLLFPIVPVGWDLIFAWRMRRQPDRKRILTRLDRIVLRTLIVNLIFVVGLAWQRPVTVYKALSVRGDWMLDGHDGPIASWLRARLFTIAEGFRRGWTPGDGARHYGDSDDAPSAPPPTPTPVPDAPVAPDGPVAPADTTAWPMPETIDPIVAAMPADVQSSIASIGAYLATNVSDPRRRVKAVHDVVVARLTYDDAALKLIEAGDWRAVPSMEAEAVFARGRGVCAGYAHLMTALGEAAGLEIAYITGYARGGVRDLGGDDDAVARTSLEGNGHAWNAARIDGHWYPIDATWDDGGDTYSTAYLLAPPTAFILDHFPEDAAWQLLAQPKTIAEFMRQPALSVGFLALGLTLRSPERSQVSVSGAIEIVIDNPRGHRAMATVVAADAPIDGRASRNCGPSEHDPQVTLRCDRLGDGEWRIDLWAAPRDESSLSYVGSIWANSR